MRALHMLAPEVNIAGCFSPALVTDCLSPAVYFFCRTRAKLEIVWCFCFQAKQVRLADLENYSYPLKMVFQSMIEHCIICPEKKVE